MIPIPDVFLDAPFAYDEDQEPFWFSRVHTETRNIGIIKWAFRSTCSSLKAQNNDVGTREQIGGQSRLHDEGLSSYEM